MKNLNKLKSALTFLTILMVIAVSLFSKISKSNTNNSALVENASILFQEQSHDFGKVKQGQSLEYSFKFTNEGNESLIIKGVQTSCGCTGATVGDKIEYAKNDSGEIKVTFNTQGREGHIEKQVTVLTNDIGNPEIVLKISCDIYSDDR